MANEADVTRARWLEAFEGTNVEPILRGFLDCRFQNDIAQFVAERASAFSLCCSDGSHPLEWTSYHREYRELFEKQLNTIIYAKGLEQEEVHNFVTFLHYNAKQIEVSYIFDGLQPGDIDQFLQWLTASEEYEAFLNVMFTEVRRQQSEQQANISEATSSQTQELEVVVPEGSGPGQAIALEYFGVRYEVTVPDGYGPGMTFRVAVALPA